MGKVREKKRWSQACLDESFSWIFYFWGSFWIAGASGISQYPGDEGSVRTPAFEELDGSDSASTHGTGFGEMNTSRVMRRQSARHVRDARE